MPGSAVADTSVVPTKVASEWLAWSGRGSRKPVKSADAGGCPVHVVGDENHLVEFTVHFHPSDDPPHTPWVIHFGAFRFERDLVIAQYVARDFTLPADVVTHVVLGASYPENTTSG